MAARWLTLLSISAFCAAVLVWTFLRWFERASLYIPDRIITATPTTYGLKYEEARFVAEDGTNLHGWFIERSPADPAMLVCHGNAGNISYRLDKARIFREAGASVFLFDYRGYGESRGSPTEQGTYQDAEAAYRYLTEVKRVPSERIVLYGESLGCGVAVELSLKRKAAGLILDSGFTSVADMGKILFPRLPVEIMVRYRYDSLSKIPKVKGPVLVMHSPQDEIVPFSMGRKLFEAAPGPKIFFEMKGGHNEGFLETGPSYAAAIRSFLEKIKTSR